MFQVGYSRIDITPTESVPLAGYGNTSTRMSDSVLDPLYSTCTALTDENGTTVMLFHNDLITSSDPISVPSRKAVSEATGIPFENIMFCSTHTHSGPDIWNRNHESIDRFIDSLPGLLTKCALEALADRKPAKAYSAKVQTEKLNFVRHYVLEDGHYKGANFGNQYSSPYAGHTTQADEEMRLVKFVREGGKDVLMVNWQIHPNRDSVKTRITSDVVGSFRSGMEAALGCHFTYFTGGAGNISPLSAIKEENRTSDLHEQGKALAEHALTAQYKELKLGPIRVASKLHQEELNRPDSEQLEAAKRVAERWASSGASRSTPEITAFAVENGFSSQYAAISVVTRSKRESDVVNLPLAAISMGDFGFCTVPYEMFDTNAKYVRDFSPFPMTFVSSSSNGAAPYIPSAYGYIHDCYEAATSLCKPGAGERAAQLLVQMLKSIK